MAISKQAIVLNENIHSATKEVTASLGPNQNQVGLLVEVVVNSEEEKPVYTEEEKLTKRMIDADDDLQSPEVNIYNADIKVISKKLDATHTLLKISFVVPGKIPGTPGS